VHNGFISDTIHVSFLIVSYVKCIIPHCHKSYAECDSSPKTPFNSPGLQINQYLPLELSNLSVFSSVLYEYNKVIHDLMHFKRGSKWEPNYFSNTSLSLNIKRGTGSVCSIRKLERNRRSILTATKSPQLLDLPNAGKMKSYFFLAICLLVAIFAFAQARPEEYTTPACEFSDLIVSDFSTLIYFEE